MKYFWVILLLSLASLHHSIAAKKAKALDKKAKIASKENTSAPKTKDSNLKLSWSEWYIVKTQGITKSVYQEEAETRSNENKISINQHWYEKDEAGAVSETLIGAISNDNKTLTPHALYVEIKSGLVGSTIEGRSANDLLNIKVSGNTKSHSISLKSGAIFSVFLPIRLARIAKTGNVKSDSFLTILEDSKSGDFSPKAGNFVLKSEKLNISGNSCYSIAINFNGLNGLWWISPDGKVCKVEFPGAATEIFLSNEAEAKGAIGI